MLHSSRWSNWRSGCSDSGVTTYKYVWVCMPNGSTGIEALPPMFPLVPPCLTGQFKGMLILDMSKALADGEQR